MVLLRPLMAKYRLYIDESGTHGYSNSDRLKQRYLALAGVFISEQQTIDVLQPSILAMKRLVAEDPDDLPVLHREEIVNKSGPFSKLNDPAIESQFNDILFRLLTETDYCICSVVLDKKTHLERYQQSALHPYHYCTTLLLERYTLHLEERGGRGDVMAEARMPDEDKALRDAYTRFYQEGTYYRGPKAIQRVLTSKELKLKPKTKMIAGLEFADLLALATKLDTLNTYGVIPELGENFCKKVVESIQPKYRCSNSGTVKGFGKKLLK